MSQILEDVSVHNVLCTPGTYLGALATPSCHYVPSHDVLQRLRLQTWL